MYGSKGILQIQASLSHMGNVKGQEKKGDKWSDEKIGNIRVLGNRLFKKSYTFLSETTVRVPDAIP